MENMNYYATYAKVTFPEGPANSSTLTKMNFVDVLYDRMGLSRCFVGPSIPTLCAPRAIV